MKEELKETAKTSANAPRARVSERTEALVFSAIMIALATVLSFIKVYQLPWGGSITLLSMLPICIVSIKYGIKRGLMTAFVYSIIQLGQGIVIDGLLGWGLEASMLIACIMLDYIAAYSVLGLSGCLRKKGTVGLIIGTVLAVILRFISHVMSGVFIFAACGNLWEGFSTDNTWIYSVLYNGSYMLPELVFTVIGAILLFKIPQLRRVIKKDA